MALAACRRRQLTGNPSCVRVAVAGLSAGPGERAESQREHHPIAGKRALRAKRRRPPSPFIPGPCSSVFFRESVSIRDDDEAQGQWSERD